MSYLQIQKKIINGRFTIPVVIIIYILLRLHAGIDLRSYEDIAALLIQIATGFLLQQFCYGYLLIRERTLLPIALYFLLAGTTPITYMNLGICVTAMIILLCFFSTIASYQQKDKPVYLFNIGLLLTVGTIFWSPMILFLPLFWIAFYLFQSLNIKSITASFLGIFVVCLFIFSWGLFTGNPSLLLEKIPHYFEDFFPIRFKSWTIFEIIRVAYTGLLVLFSFVYFVSHIFAEKIKVRTCLYYMFLFIIITEAANIISEANKIQLSAILQIPLSIVIAHYFTLCKNKLTFYLIIFSILLYLTTYFATFYDVKIFHIPWIDLKSIF